ncbi:PIN domain-containing protein [Salinarimonas soli]|uniref:Ribonuclease VapC n=1 Tax=Salinarimonas soli TaxID=1638099 RepID=A0A5B2VE04_9HYPH|nr:PIN domain-containing protein [Salinarimonas soli]KAA2237194.1 PIN domain-containing protein [Salinarimonas soli]
MTDRVFIDTNVLIYARDRKAGTKRDVARDWLRSLGETGGLVVNRQVINELTRWILAREPGRAVGDVREELDALAHWGHKAIDDEEIDVAWDVRLQLGYGWYDCLLIAAAHQAGCRFFLTEDMSAGARYAGVILVNPFTTAPDALPNLS